MYPCSTTIAIYLGTSLLAGTAYTLDTNTGRVTFLSAPTVQPIADYTAIQIPTQQIVNYCWAGFMIAQSLYSRNFVLSKSETAYAPAAPTDTKILVCQGPVSTGEVPVDPLCGTQRFSVSILQKAFLDHCSEYAYLDSMSVEAALSDVDITERVGGIKIQTSHRAQNIMRVKQTLWDSLISSMYSALDEWDPSGRHYGGNAAEIRTQFYTTTLNWQSNQGLLAPVGFVK
jgi:hypothetical protein